jgi:beta-hydroxylase
MGRKTDRGVFEGWERDFFPIESFPWTADLAAAWRSIRAELNEVMKERESIPNLVDINHQDRRFAVGGQWKTFPFYAFGHRSEENCRRCPETARLLQGVPGLRMAMFSILAPGKHLAEHRGSYNGLLRCHLGLLIPDPACRIRVGAETRHWQEGEIMIFDDTHLHEVWNDSLFHRVVLLLDIERPLNFPLSWLNRLMIWLFFRTSPVTDVVDRYRAAERMGPGMSG